MSNMTERPPIMDDKPDQMSYYMIYTLLEKANKNQEPREHSSVILIFLAVGVIIFVAGKNIFVTFSASNFKNVEKLFEFLTFPTKRKTFHA